MIFLDETINTKGDRFLSIFHLETYYFSFLTYAPIENEISHVMCAWISLLVKLLAFTQVMGSWFMSLSPSLGSVLTAWSLLQIVPP